MKQINALTWGIVLIVLAVVAWILYSTVESVKTAIDNFIHPEFPGGGATPGTSETYSGALATTITSPIATLESIFGITPGSIFGSGLDTNVLPSSPGPENTGGGVAF